MELSKEVSIENAVRLHNVSEPAIENSEVEPPSNRVEFANRSQKCPLYCPKPRRVTPFHKLSFFWYGGGDGVERIYENYYSSRENSERATANISALSGSWLTFEDCGSTGDLSDVSRRCDGTFVFGAGDKLDSEVLDWSSSPSPSYCPCSQKHCENRSMCVSEVGSLSSSFKSHQFLNIEKSKSSLLSECTSSSTNVEDFDYSPIMDEKHGELEIASSPPVRSQNPMVRDSWFRLSLKGLVLDSEAKSEVLQRSWVSERRRRGSFHSNSLLSSSDKSYAHLRPSPALSV